MGIANYAIFLLCVIVFLFLTIAVENSYAVSFGVSISKGSSMPGCEKKNVCYSTSGTEVGSKTTAIWANGDSTVSAITQVIEKGKHPH
jgi:hypothetical protein